VCVCVCVYMQICVRGGGEDSVHVRFYVFPYDAKTAVVRLVLGAAAFVFNRCVCLTDETASVEKCCSIVLI